MSKRIVFVKLQFILGFLGFSKNSRGNYRKMPMVLPAGVAGIAMFCDPDVIGTLRAKLVEINTSLESIQAQADADERELSPEETQKITDLFTLFDGTNKELERREKIAANKAAMAAVATPQALAQQPAPTATGGVVPVSGSRIIVGDEGGGTHGFRSFGEFATVVMAACAPGNASVIDPRLLIKNAPTTFGNEGVGSDGGFSVPPDFRTEIKQKVMGENSLLGMTDQMKTTSNTMTFPKDETTPWQTSGGIQAYWDGEGDQLNQSKPSLQTETLKLNRLTCLVPVTEELLEDAPALDGYLRKKVPEKMDFKVTDAIINGTGVGMPTGLLKSAATIAVAKESGQAADTIVFNNIVKMWARMYGPSRMNAVWLMNQDIEPQLFTMSFEGTSSSVPAYMPANGLSDSPYGTLMGRPVIPSMACPTLGDKGDIVLADLSEYITLMKAQGIKADVSMHLYFDYAMTAFRFILRVTGQPWWSAAVEPKNGSNTLSPFVTLAERA